MKINEITSIRYEFDTHDKDSFVNSSGIKVMFDIPYAFRFSVKFSTHTVNSAGAKIGFTCGNYFWSMVVLVFVLNNALNKFRFNSLRNKMINLILVIMYYFDFRLQFDINKKCIFQGFTEILFNSGMYSYMTSS